MASSQPAPKVTKISPKKKSSKGSFSSMSTEPFLRDTTQLFSLDTMDYDESIRIMIEFIAHHPIAVHLTKITDPPIPFCPFHTAFERLRIENDVLETKFTSNRIVHVHKSKFLKTIDNTEDLENFKFKNPKLNSFSHF